MANKKPDSKIEGTNRVLVSAPLVKKSFIKKNGQPTGRGEWYIQRSIQDYFIKFCESEVTRESLEKRLEQEDNLLQTLSMEVEFREGAWDICQDDPLEMQSRIGEYVVIFRIFP